MPTSNVQGLFDIAAGSVTGRDHVLAGRNNQDAYSLGVSSPGRDGRRL